MEYLTRMLYTEEDEELIKQEVRGCPENLQEAFYRAGKKLGVSAKSVQGRWYSNIRQGKSQFKIGKGKPNNTKNVSYKYLRETLN